MSLKQVSVNSCMSQPNAIAANVVLIVKMQILPTSIADMCAVLARRRTLSGLIGFEISDSSYGFGTKLFHNNYSIHADMADKHHCL